MTLWIVADVKSEDGRIWEFVGVFDSEAGARAACARWHFCYWPAVLNERLPDESAVHPDTVYPLERTEEDESPMNDRHNTLVAAGWHYDQASDRYRTPDSATDGTARMYNLDAAWLQYQADQLGSASTPTEPQKRQTRAADPRQQEPE